MSKLGNELGQHLLDIFGASISKFWFVIQFYQWEVRQTYRYSYQRQSKDYKFWTMSLVFNWDKLLVCKPATKLIDSCFPSWFHQTGILWNQSAKSHGSGRNGAQQGQLVHIQTIPILNLIWGWLTMKIYEISKWLGRVSSSYTSYFLIFLGHLESQHFLTHSHIKAILRMVLKFPSVGSTFCFLIPWFTPLSGELFTPVTGHFPLLNPAGRT
jgi:hypothetical protein